MSELSALPGGRSLRLLIVTTNYPRWEGDPHSPWLVELLGYLRQRGVTVHVLAPAYGGQGDHTIQGIPVYRFRYAPRRWERLTHEEGAPNKIRRNPFYLLLLPSYLMAGIAAAWRRGKAGRYDVIHVHWPVPQGLLGLAAQRAGGGRLVATFYGADLVMGRRFGFVRPFLRSFVRRCAQVAAISSFTARELAAATGVTPRVIPYGISLPEAGQVGPAERGLVLTVGRLIARKGHSYLVEAMALLRDRPHVRLVIVGEGHERPHLEALIQALDLGDRVRLAGRVPGDELERLYAACEVFVLPAIVDETGDTEMLGMVLLEAMRYRKPVIATHVGGIPDIVADGETGVLVPQRDPHALASAIARVLDEPAWAARLGQAGYAAARDRFSWAAVIRQTLELYGWAPTGQGAGVDEEMA